MMKKSGMLIMLAVGLTAAMAGVSPAADAETEAAAETETEQKLPKAIQTITGSLSDGAGEVTIDNCTEEEFTDLMAESSDLWTVVYGDDFSDVIVYEPETEADTEGSTETAQDSGSASASEDGSSENTAAANLAARTRGGQILFWYNVPADQASAISLYSDDQGTSFITMDAEGNILTDTTASPMTYYDTPQTMYATEYVYVRAQATKDSDPLGTLQHVDKVTAVGVSGNGWIMIEYKDGYGFVYQDYLSVNIDDAQAALSAEQAEEQRQAEAAAAAQAAAAQQSSSSSSSSGHSSKKSSSGKTVVSDERIPNCDDGSHGTRYITYSDGSVSVQDY